MKPTKADFELRKIEYNYSTGSIKIVVEFWDLASGEQKTQKNTIVNSGTLHPDIVEAFAALKPSLIEMWGYKELSDVKNSIEVSGISVNKKNRITILGVKTIDSESVSMNSPFLSVNGSEYGIILSDIKDTLEEEAYLYIYENKRAD